ncbi:hypothetical protein PLICRDRAFT_109834 [Plicaturopsis crispa FD-325 SS-3]|nr:hypothetical protein PLICRDRAFT_109834 [Plicaturopsis crispa FD-325 SS-3]
MPDETEPLLRPSGSGSPASTINPHDAVYERFTRPQKRIILSLVSWSGLLPLFVSGSFVPSIPQIARDFDTTGPIINLAVSVSIFSSAMGGLTWASYSTFYGRRIVYLCGLPLLVIGSLGVALASSVTELMLWRVMQAFGAAGGMSVGSGVIGDIYKLEERGTAMGIFFACVLLGPALAPLAGGLAAHYASWRVMQLSLGLSGLIAFVLMYFLLPETSHPNARGIDKLAAEEGLPEGVTPRKWVWVNPMGSLRLLRSPNLVAVMLAGTAVLLTDFVLLIPMAYTVGVRFNITNEAIIGACFLPAGLGNITGAPLAGWYSDRVVVKWRKRRGGVWVPEDRLRATLSGALVLVPLSVFSAGLFMTYVPGTLGLTLTLICFYFNGVGIDMVLSPSSAYGTDILHAHSAEVMAASGGTRAIILASATTVILPLINTIGIVYTAGISALLAWAGFGLLWTTIHYGDRMRAWADVGYSTADNN